MIAISVVIPTYNAAPFIRETLTSVFRQRLQPREIVVVDDASTDGTADVVECAAATSPAPVRLVRRTCNSGGPARPLNEGIAAAQGKLIATLDHDDIMLPDKLALLSECRDRATGAGLVFGWCNPFPADRPTPVAVREVHDYLLGLPHEPLGEQCRLIRSRDAHAALVPINFTLTCSNLLFPKSVWADCGGFDERIRAVCDYGFVAAVSRHYDFAFTDQVLLRWRTHAGSLANTASCTIRDRDYVNVHTNFDASRLGSRGRKALQRELARDYRDLAYGLRQQGDYLGALVAHLKGLHRGGWNWRTFAGIPKLLPHWLMSELGRKADTLPGRP